MPRIGRAVSAGKSDVRVVSAGIGGAVVADR